jgi:hypothetical protein
LGSLCLLKFLLAVFLAKPTIFAYRAALVKAALWGVCSNTKSTFYGVAQLNRASMWYLIIIDNTHLFFDAAF